MQDENTNAKLVLATGDSEASELLLVLVVLADLKLHVGLGEIHLCEEPRAELPATEA